MRRVRMMGLTAPALAAVMASAGMAHAAAPSSASRGRPGRNHAAPHVVGRLPRPLGSGTDYIYAQDGTCPDGIDVYQVSGTGLSLIQNVRGGCSENPYLGNHHLAVVKTPANCLMLTDGDGNVYSFTIDPSDGTLSPSPVGAVSVGGDPGDLAVSGSTVYESNSNSSNGHPTIDVLTVGDGCSLTLDSQNSTGSEDDINIALTSPTTVVSADANTGRRSGTARRRRDMVAYTLQEDGTLAETASGPGQIASPDSVAATGLGSKSLVFTGQAVDGPPQTQGFVYSGSGFNPLPGSPLTSTDPNALDGAAVALSVPNGLLVQADNLTGQIGWDTLTGSRMAYAGDTLLAQNGADPTELTVLGNDLLVAQDDNGDLEACALAPSGVSNCRSIATLTGAGSGDSGSTAVFSP